MRLYITFRGKKKLAVTRFRATCALNGVFRAPWAQLLTIAQPTSASPAVAGFAQSAQFSRLNSLYSAHRNAGSGDGHLLFKYRQSRD